MMNKIVVDEYDVFLENRNGTLEISKNVKYIHLKGTNNISGISLENNDTITLVLEDNASLNLTINALTEHQQNKIIINSKNTTQFVCRMNLEVKENLSLEFQNNLLGNNNVSHILIHAVTEQNGNCKIKTTGTVKKDTVDNEFLEEIKGLTIASSTITFLPDLIVDSDSVVANHNATIKQIESDELFYLQSKGISLENAINLIKEGFLNKLK